LLEKLWLAEKLWLTQTVEKFFDLREAL